MNTQTVTEYRNVPLALLTESTTNPRRIFEDAALRGIWRLRLTTHTRSESSGKATARPKSDSSRGFAPPKPPSVLVERTIRGKASGTPKDGFTQIASSRI